MKYWKDDLGSMLCEPNCAEEWCEMIQDIAFDYDGCESAESLKELIDELSKMAGKARACIQQNHIRKDDPAVVAESNASFGQATM